MILQNIHNTTQHTDPLKFDNKINIHNRSNNEHINNIMNGRDTTNIQIESNMASFYNNKSNNTNNPNNQSDMILHDIFITMLASGINGIISVLFFIANILHCVFSDLYNRFVIKHYIRSIITILVRFLIIPVIETLYPVFDIELKFDQIHKLYKTNKGEEYSDIELTQNMWNSYIMYLQKTDKSKFDLFDILISQKIEQINFAITVAINRSDTNPRCISYGLFYNKLLHILGEAVNIRYRITKNKIFFVGIFGDDSPYRRFRYYDVI